MPLLHGMKFAAVAFAGSRSVLKPLIFTLIYVSAIFGQVAFDLREQRCRAQNPRGTIGLWCRNGCSGPNPDSRKQPPNGTDRGRGFACTLHQRGQHPVVDDACLAYARSVTGHPVRPPRRRRSLSFSLLLPARHEQAVLEHTVNQLLESSHADYEIIVIVGHDDPEHHGRWRAAWKPRIPTGSGSSSTPTRRRTSRRPSTRRCRYCRGDVVGVFDAEDQVHPELLAHVDHAFRTTGADVVQGGVQLINFHSSWYSLRNCLEYFFWFRSRLHLHAQKGFIPLGGNTVFVRTDVLRAADGWDPNCLAEDCDLGVRLSSVGKKVVVAYDSAMVTREETPGTLMSLLKQRTRWNQGFLQVYRKKDWKQLPGFGQRMLARYTLMTPFLQAFSGLVIPLNVAIALFLDVPVGIASSPSCRSCPTLVTFVFELVGLHDFGKQYGLRVRFVHYVKLIVGAPSTRSSSPAPRSARSGGSAGTQRLGADQPCRRASTEHRRGASGRTGDRRADPASRRATDARRSGRTRRCPPCDATSEPRPPRPAVPPASRPDLWLAAPGADRRRSSRAGTSPTSRRRSDDEGTYLAQAWAVQQGHGLAHYTYWYDHPPLGWIQIAGPTWLPPMLLPDIPAVAAGRLVMLLVHRRQRRAALHHRPAAAFSRWAAALAVLLFGLSPLAVRSSGRSSWTTSR